RNMNLTQAWALELIYSAAELFCFIIPCTIGGIMMMQGSLSVGTLFMMVDLAMNFITPVVTLFNEFNQVKSDRKSTRLNSSHVSISYAVFCLKKKKSDIKV